MPTIDDPEEKRRRAVSVGAMLHFLAEGITDGTWTQFKFKVRQHRVERRSVGGMLLHAGPSRVEITFSMDVDESAFTQDVERRRQEVSRALAAEIGNVVEHEGDPV